MQYIEEIGDPTLKDFLKLTAGLGLAVDMCLAPDPLFESLSQEITEDL